MRAGKLRSRVTLQKRMPSTDAEGSTSDNWITLGRVWAHLAPVAGVEALVAGQEEVRLSHQVSTRYRADLAAASTAPVSNEGHNLRLLLGPRVLDIQTVSDPDERHVEVDLLCIERQR